MTQQNDQNIIYLDGSSLTIEKLIDISENNRPVAFRDETIQAIKSYREGLIDHLKLRPDIAIYGVNTGCGDLLSSWLMNDEREEYLRIWEAQEKDPESQELNRAFKTYIKSLESYQEKYIKAHNCGTGSPLPIRTARAIMVIRLNSFAKCYSAISWNICRMMIEMLNRGVTPWILEEGSVGASGDLIPLAMMGAVMIGLPEAKAYYKNDLLPADEALKIAGLSPIRLGPKEAMGLTNGSNFISALCAFAVRDTENLLKSASISAALSLEAIRGERDAFDARIADARRHEGQIVISRHIREMLEGSKRTSRDAQKIPFAYPLLIEDDILAPEKIVEVLYSENPYFEYLFQMIGSEGMDRINSYMGTEKSHSLKSKIAEELNQLIGNRYFYDYQVFEKIKISVASRKIIDKIDADFDTIVNSETSPDIDTPLVFDDHETLTESEYRILNRLIIEHIFKDCIRKRDGLSERPHFPPQSPETARPRIQDRYGFRAIPQVHGPLYEALKRFRETVEIEINSATDNPLLFDEATKPGGFRALSAANFHGQPLAAVIDYLKSCITAVALITDKRCFAMLDKHQSFGLPGDLGSDSSQSNTGLMIAQYAGAARAAECRVLSTPSSVMSVSTSANQEDFVSMGSIGALHLEKIIYNTQIIVAMETLCALRALQLTEDMLPKELRVLGKGTTKAYEYLSTILPPAFEDRYLRLDMEKAIEIVKSGELVEKIKKRVSV